MHDEPPSRGCWSGRSLVGGRVILTVRRTSLTDGSNNMRFRIRSLLLMIFTCTLCIGLVRQCFGPVISRSTLAEIEPGDSKHRVRELLGSPNGTITPQSWGYERSFNPGWVTVYFDKDGRVMEVNDESP